MLNAAFGNEPDNWDVWVQVPVCGHDGEELMEDFQLVYPVDMDLKQHVETRIASVLDNHVEITGVLMEGERTPWPAVLSQEQCADFLRAVGCIYVRLQYDQYISD